MEARTKLISQQHNGLHLKKKRIVKEGLSGEAENSRQYYES